jgi:hypothetical protein
VKLWGKTESYTRPVVNLQRTRSKGTTHDKVPDTCARHRELGLSSLRDALTCHPSLMIRASGQRLVSAQRQIRRRSGEMRFRACESSSGGYCSCRTPTAAGDHRPCLPERADERGGRPIWPADAPIGESARLGSFRRQRDFPGPRIHRSGMCFSISHIFVLANQPQS